MTETGVFMVATLVDWHYEDQLDKTWKKMKKLFKKKFGGANPQINKLNTFVVTQVEITKLPSRKIRLEVEEEVKKLLKEYADSIYTAHYGYIKRQGTIADIYKKGFESLNRKDLYERYINEKADQFDNIERGIEIVGAKGGVIIWDLPGYEGDKLILPDCVATFSDYPEDTKHLIEIIDEVLVANFAQSFLPFSYNLIREVESEFIKINDFSSKLNKDDRIPKSLLVPLQTFIGVISGIQEVLKLFKREVRNIDNIAVHAFNYLKRLPSKDLQSWATIEDPKLGDKIIHLIDNVMDIIVRNKIGLRNLLIGEHDLNQILTDEIMERMVEIDVISGGLLAWVHRFEQLPSLTTLEVGIAYEELEGETYWPKDKDAVIEGQTIFKTFKRGGSYIYALRGVDISINEGEFVVIRGPSGAGKTTLLNILAGLDVPERGGVFFLGKDIINMNEKDLAKLRLNNYSFIFQNYALIPHLTAFENAKVPLDLANNSNDLVKGIQKILDGVGIGEYREHKPALLSGGQMQRLAITRALVNNPKILFADEPTGDLDEATGRSVMDLLKRYHEETGMTIILVTHNEEIAEYATREIFLMDGKIVEQLEVV